MVTADELRRLVLGLPEVEERETWGEATFRVRDKIFAMLGPSGETASIKATVPDQQALIAMAPATFSPSAYTGRFGWVSVRLAAVDPALLAEIVAAAWRRTAPRRLAAAFDQQPGSNEPAVEG